MDGAAVFEEKTDQGKDPQGETGEKEAGAAIEVAGVQDGRRGEVGGCDTLVGVSHEERHERGEPEAVPEDEGAGAGIVFRCAPVTATRNIER